MQRRLDKCHCTAQRYPRINPSASVDSPHATSRTSALAKNVEPHHSRDCLAQLRLAG